MERISVDSRAHGVAARPETDPLTGLCSQSWFSACLDRMIAEEPESGHGILALLQLANFYEILAWMGRIEADLLLTEIARLLGQAVPDDSLLCHCRNHEFAVLFKGQGMTRVRLIAESLQQELHRGAALSIPPQLKLQCAVGLASMERDSPSATVLFARARHDLALRQTRQTEGGGLLSAAGGVDTTVILQNLRQCLAKRNLDLAFHAIVDLDACGPARLEARALLPAEGGRPMTPGEFLGPVVRNAMGEAFDRSVIATLTRRLLQIAAEEEWTKSPPSLEVFVNLTQNSLVSRRFPDWLEQICRRFPPLAGVLVLQLSEIDILCAQHHVTQVSRRLKNLGIKVCVNHFGCTANPLRYLPLLRTAYAKLDPSLCENLHGDGAARETLASLAAALRKRGIRPIGCKLDRLSTVVNLWRAGVSLVQGNGLSAAQPHAHRVAPQTIVLK